MSRTEATSRNATLSINTQVDKQREATAQTFTNISGKVFGVGKNNEQLLFPDSPIGYDENLGDRQENVYESYSKVIDNDSEVQGFGFYGNDHAHMNYNHVNNPFLQGDYTTLTSGAAHNDEQNKRKAYKGFPDLNVSGIDIHSPALGQDELIPAESQITLNADGASYGSTTTDDRIQTPDLLGKHINSGEGNGDQNTLGKYFKLNYTTQE